MASFRYLWFPRSTTERQNLGLLRKIEPDMNTPWLCVGDFNEIIWSTEKKGGNLRFTKSMDTYRRTMMDLRLQDLGFQGYKFTWTNARGGAVNIQCRLDRAWANSSWRVMFPHHPIYYRSRLKSDHAHLVIHGNYLKTQTSKKRRRKKLYRFEKLWLESKECEDIVKRSWGPDTSARHFGNRTTNCGMALDVLGNKTFGDLKQKIEDECLGIKDLQKGEMNETNL